MIDRTLNKYVNEALELKMQIEALQAKYDAHKDKIKAEMTERGISEYSHGTTRVQYIRFPKRTFDKKAFEKVYPDLVKEYTKVGEQTRFTIA